MRVQSVLADVIGFGQATAEQLVARGASVVIADIQDDLGQSVAARLGVTYKHCNITCAALYLSFFLILAAEILFLRARLAVPALFEKQDAKMLDLEYLLGLPLGLLI